MLYFAIGCAIALGVTLVVRAFFGFGGQPRSDSFGFWLAFRAIAEAVLVAGFVGALISVAVLHSTPAWQIFGGYALIRVLALGLETAANRK